tara:strand:- start:5016 stop:5876 length:861 start_codon:yes stop_codon:yes gene_type:complete
MSKLRSPSEKIVKGGKTVSKNAVPNVKGQSSAQQPQPAGAAHESRKPGAIDPSSTVSFSGHPQANVGSAVSPENEVAGSGEKTPRGELTTGTANPTETEGLVYQKITDNSIDFTGRFVKTTDGWGEHYVTYCSDKWMYATGLGKRGTYPILRSELSECTDPVELTLAKTFKKRYTYLTDGNTLYCLIQGEEGNSLSVLANSQVGSWVSVSDSLVYLYQLPSARLEGGRSSCIMVLYESDEKYPSNIKTLHRPTVSDSFVSEYLPESDCSEDLAVEDFAIRYYFEKS